MAAETRPRLITIAAVLVTSGAIAACGSSKSTSSVAAAASTSTTAPATTSTTSSTTATAASTTTPGSTTTTTAGATGSPNAAAASTAPPPTPAGTPPAPAGLRQTTGYSTYELCSVHCSGVVPPSLRVKLRIPAKCAATAATGPVKPSVTGTLPVTGFIGSKWKAGRVTWSAPQSFSGPILIRGRAVGGARAVGFGEGRVPYDELQLYAVPGKPHTWPSFARVLGPGCYAFQVDTAGTRAVISFVVR